MQTNNSTDVKPIRHSKPFDPANWEYIRRMEEYGYMRIQTTSKPTKYWDDDYDDYNKYLKNRSATENDVK